MNTKPLVTAVVIAAIAEASAVSISSNVIQARVGILGTDAISNFNGTGIPTSHSLSATQGAFFSNIQIDSAGVGDQVTFSNSVEQERSGAHQFYAQGYLSAMHFTVGSNTTYDLSGSYSVTDTGPSSGDVYFRSSIYDVTASSFLVRSLQYSQNTPNETFVLGLSEGDHMNIAEGSLSGSLLVGHTYRWEWNTITQAWLRPDDGANASGQVVLKIGGGDPTSAPDGGATAVLGCLALLGLAAAGRKMR